jgi:hypothetical protein
MTGENWIDMADNSCAVSTAGPAVPAGDRA